MDLMSSLLISLLRFWKVNELNSNYTNYNYTNNIYTDNNYKRSTTAGGNTLFSKGNQVQATSLPAASNLSKFNNLILENFGKFPTPLQVDDMRYMLEEHQLDVITLAVKECVDYGKPRFSYLKTILDNWKHDGLTTPELVKNRVKPRSKSGKVTMLDDGYDPKLGI